MVKVFIVFSPRPTDYASVEGIVLNYAKTLANDVLLVKENGKNGDHPHLNLVYSDIVKHINNVYRKIKDLFPKSLLISNKRLVSIKEVYDIKTLVQGYLTKESTAMVLYTKGKNVQPNLRNKLLDELIEEIKTYPKLPEMTLEEWLITQRFTDCERPCATPQMLIAEDTNL